MRYLNEFKNAKPVFVPEMSAVPNVLAAFRCDFKGDCSKGYRLTLAAHTFYRVYINGKLIGIGPAPAPFGQLKADCYDLAGLIEEENKLAIEVMGYVPEENNYATHESSCLLAEITEEDRIVVYTGDGNWKCGVLQQKDSKVETLSFGRRVPLEAYHLDEAYSGWRTGKIQEEMCCQETKDKRVIRSRGIAMPDISIQRDFRLVGVCRMEVAPCDLKERSWWESDAYISRSGGSKIGRPSYECLAQKEEPYTGELEEDVSKEGIRCYTLNGYEEPAGLEFAMKEVETGFIGISFESEEPVTVDIIWNDYLDEEGRIPVKADSVNRVIRLQTEGGSFTFEAMEPHFVKYIKVIFRGGKRVALNDLYVRAYRFPDTPTAEFVCSDASLNRIYEGARRTLLTNSLAFFLDSPERERGGWAGDSYWSGRAAAMILSDTTLEKAMLEDFLAADYSPMLEGSFPACCSGGAKKDPVMMYSWNLFVLLELTDYYRRTKDEEMKEDFKERVSLFIESSQGLKNQLGILENVPGAMFIDWSSSNDDPNTKPICTAANSLYAMVTEQLGMMYERRDFIEEAEHIRLVLRNEYEKVKGSKQDLFTMYPYLADSMTNKDGVLEGNGIYSEAAQYYFLWSGLLTRETAPELVQVLKEQFGPAPEKYRGTAHLRVGNCGVFFGHMMRFELLGRMKEIELLEVEMKKLCGYMLDQEPGTFWETLSGTDSRNHGFGSYYGVILVRDFLGIDIPDRLEKRVRFAPQIGSLKWSKGSILTEDGRITASWNKTESGLHLQMSAPESYEIEVELPGKYCCGQTMTVNGKHIPFQREITTGNTVSILLYSR